MKLLYGSPLLFKMPFKLGSHSWRGKNNEGDGVVESREWERENSLYTYSSFAWFLHFLQAFLLNFNGVLREWGWRRSMRNLRFNNVENRYLYVAFLFTLKPLFILLFPCLTYSNIPICFKSLHGPCWFLHGLIHVLIVVIKVYMGLWVGLSY